MALGAQSAVMVLGCERLATFFEYRCNQRIVISY